MAAIERSASGHPSVKSRPTTPSHRDAPPQTPVTKVKAGTTSSKDKAKAGNPTRARGARSPSSCSDSVTPSPEVASHLDGRDSHDLSLSPRHVTRDSIVDHMLLSLDQISIGAAVPDIARPYPSFDRDESSVLPPRAPRRQGHSYTNSLSSDYNSFADDPSERLTALGSRRPHSNSGPHFPTALDRIDSARTERPPAGRSHARGNTGEEGSNGSGSSDLEFGYAQTYASNRWAFPLDPPLDGRLLHSSPSNPSTMPAVNLSHSSSAAYDNYDAAPTPTIPAGPRRNRSSPPSSIHASQSNRSGALPPPLFMRGNSRPASGAGQGARGPDVSTAAPLGDGLGDELTVPAIIDPPAPSPTISFHKLPTPAPVVATPPAKSRPGFFRRVFGSSKNSSPSLQRNISAPQLPPVGHLSSQSRSRPGSQGKSDDSAPRPDGAPRAISDENTATLARPQPSTLTKKPSSFFRRRKRSISVQNATSMVPNRLQPPTSQGRATPDPSPVSSLRTAMDPFLKKAGEPAQEELEQKDENAAVNGDQEEDRPRGFSPGYHPHKNATIRTVQPVEQDEDDMPTPTARKEKRAPLPDFTRTAALDLNENVKPPPSKPAFFEGSFLHDNSDEEDDIDLNESVKPGAAQALTTSSTAQKQTAALNTKQKPGISISKPTLFAPDGGMQKSKSEGALPVGETSKSGWAEKKTKEQQMVASERNSPAPPEGQLTPASGLSLPLEGPTLSTKASASSISDYKSASSLPIVQIDDEEISEDNPAAPRNGTTDQRKLITEEDRERAQDIFDGGEQFVSKVQAAGWLGDATPVSERTRIAYMELYDWSSMSILFAMRSLCNKLVLRGETQQVDRVLDAFSSRWCECNPNHGFKAKDVVHTVAYSLLLLNTDLHLADIESKMTRNQFIKNTVPTIRRVALDAAPGEVETIRASTIPSRGSIPWVEPGSLNERASTMSASESKDRRPSSEGTRPTQTLLKRFSQASGHDEVFGDKAFDECGPLVNKPFSGSEKAWEFLIEAVLRACYNSIRQNRLPLHGVMTERGTDSQASSSNNLSVHAAGVLRRSPSTISKAPSENFSFRGRPMDSRSTTGRLASKGRSRPRIYHHSTVSSSRTSLDDQSSVFSPSTSSSTWSKYSLGKVNSAFSVDTFGSSQPPGDYKQSIGFANALSQAIIREETAGSIGSDESIIRPMLEDETLELAGAPWAKEGIIKHKHHLDAADKRSKDRTWTECFAVVEKGWVRLFSFHAKSASMRHKNRNRPAIGGVVGGGNWSENAEDLGSFMLRHTIASALPPPGYSKSRPHVWALSLPSGAVHFFQVGTPEIVKEFVSTANYWSARLSKEPMMGGISNIEYGWSDAVINPALVGLDKVPSQTPAAAAAAAASAVGPRPSLQSSIRSSLDHGPASRARLPGDRVMISDWTPPQQSMMASVLLEEDQLSSLKAYVKNVETELQKHNELRSPLLLAFSSRHPNASKALANWERKSSYLLKEIVKFRTYIDSLNHAQTAKAQVYASRPTSSAAEKDGPSVPEERGKKEEVTDEVVKSVE